MTKREEKVVRQVVALLESAGVSSPKTQEAFHLLQRLLGPEPLPIVDRRVPCPKCGQPADVIGQTGPPAPTKPLWECPVCRHQFVLDTHLPPHPY